MAAYAALVSLMHIINQIEHHPLSPISLDKKQIESLTKNVTFLQEFLEGYPHTGKKEEGDGVESRVADAAYAAEDVIESHIVDQILAGSTCHGEKSDHFEFCQRLQKVIEDMVLVKNEVMKIKEKMGVKHQLQRSLTSSSSGQNTTTVGFDDVLLEILDKLVGGEVDRQIIPIVGMGGIGKTTLARNVYVHPLIKEHFDICVWVTISQEYNTRQILREVLSQANQGRKGSSEMNENEIGEDLYKYLSGRKYLIIMDDMWSIEAWDRIKFFFPDYNNGSRIVVTTRLSNLARQLTNSCGLDMNFLDEDKSWDLFSKIVFPKEGCPLELEEIGKKIVRSCRGLPLSIVVIGGSLAKSDYTREYWEHIEENLNSTVNSENDEHCLKILEMSYNELAVHLKPCFLYMGVFKEDSAIRVSKLVKLWVAEGFLKPIRGKSLEEVAKEYLKDLVDRNLILVHGSKSIKMRAKHVNIHDLLRDFCLKQAQKERFYCVISQQHSVSISQEMHTQRRFIISYSPLEEKVLDALLSLSLARSLICNFGEVLPSLDHRLLRVFEACDEKLFFYDSYFLENKLQLVNLRYVVVQCIPCDSKFAPSLHLLWSLQTLIIDGDYCDGFAAPIEIWNMPQLRHVQITGYLCLPEPPRLSSNEQDDIVLENLQTLMIVRNFKCGEEVVKRIPNIKKMWVEYVDELEESWGNFDLNNLHRLHKLKSFHCNSFPYPEPSGTGFLQDLAFPQSLKKLYLAANHVHWEDMLEKIGSLHLLQKLELNNGSFRTRTWETVEGQFPSLKFLKLHRCDDLEYWTSESSHFPRLEHLVLHELHDLNEIPSDIGEIQTLQSIELEYCCETVVISAKRMQEEQEELYGEEVALRVRIKVLHTQYEALKDLASPNFELVE